MNCACRDGKCDCDACWSMWYATGGQRRSSPLCERCGGTGVAHCCEGETEQPVQGER